MNRRNERPPGERQSVAVHKTHTGGRELLESGVAMTFKCLLVALHQPPPKALQTSQRLPTWEQGLKTQGCLPLWFLPVIPALGRQKQEDKEFKARLSYIKSSRLA